jgi:7-cyano-7-deazaguanine synthase in queuosine biosynthesis
MCSGGLTRRSPAKSPPKEPLTRLLFDYRQRHNKELKYARR